MNKTINVNINNKKFDLDEEAYEVLNQYLTSVQKHFSSHEDKEEIINDIENSIAAKFLEKLSKHKHVITKGDVEDIIKNLGTIEDFEQFEPQNKKQTAEETTPISSKKLYRDPDDKILGGVASGLAAYFGIEVTLVRILFVVTTLFTGFGLILYLVLWLIVPEAKTAAQKIEMYGGKATLSSIQMKVSNPPSEETLESRKTIRKVIGIILIIISSLILLFSLFFFNIFSMTGGGIVPLFFLVLYFLIVSPFLLLLSLGIKLVKNQKISKALIITLLLIGLLSVGLISGYFTTSHVIFSPF